MVGLVVDSVFAGWFLVVSRVLAGVPVSSLIGVGLVLFFVFVSQC